MKIHTLARKTTRFQGISTNPTEILQIKYKRELPSYEQLNKEIDGDCPRLQISVFTWKSILMKIRDEEVVSSSVSRM